MNETDVTQEVAAPAQPARRRMYSLWMIGVLIVFGVCEKLLFTWGFEAAGYAAFGLMLALVFCIIRGCRVFLPPKLGNFFIVLLALLCFIQLTVPFMGTAREAARRCQCMSNLKQLGLALYNYEDMHGQSPPAFVADEAGRKMHSWRTLILPYIGRQDLYTQYDFKKPWDSPENQELAAGAVIEMFQCPSVIPSPEQPENRTDYVAVLGEDTFWRPDGTPRKREEITADLSNVPVLIEISDSDIPWHEPRDVKLDDFLSGKLSWSRTGVHGGCKSAFFYEYPGGGGRNVVFVDGSVHFLQESNPTPDQLRRFFSITEPFDLENESFDQDTELTFTKPRPIVFRHVVFYVWLATLVMQFLYIFFPVRKRAKFKVSV